ncbi:arylsulfatase [Serratia fonticola]|uniref:arylsulfatase n=1 Tax=Serratia fonticola TaxID=47917 RepID=UPI00093AE545|nr:arylsulfatase [Serratia fonticola]OKP30469.1 arylsulfatase [Serratia fonticola]
MKKKTLAVALSSALSGMVHAADGERPNVLIIIADDMGYSDISPFGGEIPTPNLQALAEQGVRMSQYYTSPMSAPARSMLMTGNTNQQAGMGGMWWYESTVARPGYEMRLTDRVTTMPERFKDAGYATMMAGKWHLGYTDGAGPTDRGFERAFAFMGGGTSHFDDAVPLGTVEAFHTFYTLNGKRVSLPQDFYSSKAYATQLEQWITDTPKDQPVFAYLAFTAPHDPLQAPDDWIAKFDGKYDAGYQQVYQQRINRLKALGIISDSTPMPHLALEKEWQAMTPEQRKYAAKTMQVYAAMIAYMDDQIGGVMKTLQQTGRDKNTIIIFATDNGANPASGFYYGSKPEFWQQFDNSYANLGRKGSFISYGPHWANVSNAPYANYHKTTSAQGGINTDFIISAPQLKQRGGIDKTPMAVYDIAPTLYEFANIDASKPLKAKPAIPMIGVSFKRYFSGDIAAAPRSTYGVELHNQAAYVDGIWKLRRLVAGGPQANMAAWGLFNLQDDPLETRDLAASQPDRVKRLSGEYQQYADKGMVVEAAGKEIDYLGVDPQTHRYIGLDPVTQKPVLQAAE